MGTNTLRVYRRFGDVCVFDPHEFCLVTGQDKGTILGLLRENFGIFLLGNDTVVERVRRECLEKSVYRFSAKLADAPDRVSCITLIRYALAMRGIESPGTVLGVYESGLTNTVESARALDVALGCPDGKEGYFLSDPGESVRHAALVTERGTVLEAKQSKKTVIEIPLLEFVSRPGFRMIVRFCPHRALTLNVSSYDFIVDSTDVGRVLLGREK